MSSVRILLAALIAATLLGACTSNTPESAPATSTEEATPADPMVDEPTQTPAPSPTATPAPTATPELMREPLPADDVFTVYSDDPVVPHGPSGAWDGQFTDPGGAVYHDGTYHMFHNGFVGWPAPVGIAYSNSPDGYTWTRITEDPVFKGNDLDYVGLTALASSALVEDDGTWVLYFYTWDADSWPAPTKIGRATAPAPSGPWMADEAPVLEPGPEGAWDAYAVRAPSVVRTDDGYAMFYSGYTTSQAMIGMATSEDGIRWVKHDDPTTTQAPFAESDPVFQPGEPGTWDANQVYQPRVQRTPDGWVMLYSVSRDVRGTNSQLGYAISPDGIRWARSEGPILRASAVPGGRAIWYTELLYQDDTYFVYFELGTGGMTEVYLATHDGSLKP